ncbi:MAG: cytochrome c oxidase subunit 3 family protein [Acidimicrobiia bacterium]|nr:cytochrome c oxidase subunit 3 family protein [Acidimicrobiia bacterium]
MSDHSSHGSGLAHQFDDLDQQLDATTLGMWLFLAQEIMFFGGLFAAYTIYRNWHPEAFAEASHHLDIKLGGFNTVVLIFSSLTMALGVRAAQMGKNKAVFNYLFATFMLGNVFLVVKAFEYHHKWVEGLIPGPWFRFEGSTDPAVQMFFNLYFAMTGMHALHMIIGGGLLIYFMVQARKNRYHEGYYGPVEIMGLYWHFVDIVWIFLFPLLYLLGLHNS